MLLDDGCPASARVCPLLSSAGRGANFRALPTYNVGKSLRGTGPKHSVLPATSQSLAWAYPGQIQGIEKIWLTATTFG